MQKIPIIMGERTQTSIAILYVADLLKPGLLEEIERRLSLIRIDKILSVATYVRSERLISGRDSKDRLDPWLWNAPFRNVLDIVTIYYKV